MGKRRTINPDRIGERNVPAPETEVVAARLEELLSPLVYNQLGYYQQLGLSKVADTRFTLNDGGCVNLNVATSAVCTGTPPYVTSIRLVVVSSSAGIPTSII